jgi:hypothetical protein
MVHLLLAAQLGDLLSELEHSTDVRLSFDGTSASAAGATAFPLPCDTEGGHACQKSSTTTWAKCIRSERVACPSREGACEVDDGAPCALRVVNLALEAARREVGRVHVVLRLLEEILLRSAPLSSCCFCLCGVPLRIDPRVVSGTAAAAQLVKHRRGGALHALALDALAPAERHVGSHAETERNTIYEAQELKLVSHGD